MTAVRLNWFGVVAVAAVFVVPTLVWLLGIDPRLAGVVTGVLATALLAFRFFAHLDQTPAIVRVVVVLLIATLALSAIGQAQLVGTSTALTIVAYPLIGHRVACILLGVYWPFLVGAGMRSPLVRSR